MENKKLVTLFTPTYNREKLLPRLYQSLCNQTSSDFTWLVIDDGSTDHTEELILRYISEQKIDIKYYKKSNGGKYTAYNFALNRISTELVMIAMDSDDWLKPDAVEKIVIEWNKVERLKLDVAGMVFMCEKPSGELMLTSYNEQHLKKNPSLQEALIHHWFYGEAEYIFKTEYIKNFQYPGKDGEHFFNESYTYIQMDRPMKWNKESIYVRDYQKDGMTQNFLQLILNNPVNYAMYSNMMAKWNLSYIQKIKYTVYFDAFSIYGGDKFCLKNASCPRIASICYPMSAIIATVLGRKARNMGIL